MGNGECGMGNGEWGMGNVECGMGNGIPIVTDSKNIMELKNCSVSIRN